jgi:hypothetical protein
MTPEEARRLGRKIAREAQIRDTFGIFFRNTYENTRGADEEAAWQHYRTEFLPRLPAAERTLQQCCVHILIWLEVEQIHAEKVGSGEVVSVPTVGPDGRLQERFRLKDRPPAKPSGQCEDN